MDVVGRLDTSDEVDQSVPLKPISNPRMEGGNIVVVFNNEVYYRGVNELKFSIVCRLSLHRSEVVPNTVEINRILENLWSIKELKAIPLGKGTFHILLHRF